MCRTMHQNAAAIVVRLDQWLSTGGPRHASRVDHSVVLERSSGPRTSVYFGNWFEWRIMLRSTGPNGRHIDQFWWTGEADLGIGKAMTFFFWRSPSLPWHFTLIPASDIVTISSNFLWQWATNTCGLLKWATARKRLRTTGLHRWSSSFLQCIPVLYVCMFLKPFIFPFLK